MWRQPASRSQTGESPNGRLLHIIQRRLKHYAPRHGEQVVNFVASKAKRGEGQRVGCCTKPGPLATSRGTANHTMDCG